MLAERMTYHFSKSGNDLAQGGQALVDVGTFLEAGALGTGRIRSLRTSQIYQADFGDLLRLQASHLIDTPLREEYCKHSMRAGARFIHIGSSNSSVTLPFCSGSE